MLNFKLSFKRLKQSLVLVFALFLSTAAIGQDYYHGFGAQLDIRFFNKEYGGISESNTPGVPGIFYKATLALSDNLAVSAYPFVGFSGSFNSRSGGTGSVGVQLPVLAELYFGDLDDTCFYIGAGGAFAAIGSTDAGGGTVLGPQVGVGGQFEISRRLIGLRAVYTLGVNKSELIQGIEYTKDTHNLVSLGIYYVLGQ